MKRQLLKPLLAVSMMTAHAIVFPSISTAQIQKQETQNMAPQWELQWSDEFAVDGLPDPAKWDYEEGLVRNQEPQYYTRRPENARVEGGMLVIEGRKEQFANPRYKEGSDNWKEQKPFAPYTSASLTTQGKASWTYGRIEVRAKLPQGKGMWPAIWTLGDNISQIGWPRCGEIDIMEFVGKEPNKLHGTTHFSVDDKHRSKGQSLTVERPFDDFHLYAVEWFPDRIDFFFDQTKFHSFPLDEAGAGPENPFRKPHYLLMNLAIGGTWGGEVDDSVLPQKYFIDYVRVYQAKTPH
jgi:beta-glucanase (GH16 family)